VAPPLLVPGAALLSEPLFLVLELAALAAVLEHRASRYRYRWAAVAGVLAGLAILTRTNGIVLLLPLAIGAWALAPRLSLRSLAQPALLLVAAALTVMPWTVRNLIVMDAFVPVTTQSGYTLAVTYNDAARTDPERPSSPHYVSEYTPLTKRKDLDEVELEGELSSRATDYMLEHPGYVVLTAVRNLGRSLHLDGLTDARLSAVAVDIPRWLADLGVYGFYLLALLALAGALLPPARRAPWFVWLAPALLLLSAVIISGKTRYRVTIDPFLVMLAGIAVMAAWERFTSRRRLEPA
jgi:4-amino-4-deoxy-L-arabinose transferase-like glycosyltransferase